MCWLSKYKMYTCRYSIPKLNWHYTRMTLLSSRNHCVLTPSLDDSLLLWTPYTDISQNGNSVWTLTKPRLYCSPNVVLPVHPISQFQHTAIPWSPHIQYLSLVLDSKLLFTKHLHTVTCKATDAFLQLFPLLARDSTLSIPNKLTLYKLCICPILTYAAPIWSNTSSYN
jgi:hypothetical protein